MRGENIGEREGRANGKGEKSKEPLTQIAVSFIGIHKLDSVGAEFSVCVKFSGSLLPLPHGI